MTKYVLFGALCMCLWGCRSADIDAKFGDIQGTFVSQSMIRYANDVPDKAVSSASSVDKRVPQAFAPWWLDDYDKPLLGDRTSQSLRIERLIPYALKHSFQIKSFADIPLIRETTIEEAKGAFVPRLFVKGRYDEINEPVGSTLRTGGDPVYMEESYSIEAGIKKKFITGGQLELAQKVGFIDNNSEYFDPKEQAKTKLSLNLNQPLLNGAGKYFNEAQTVLAMLDSRVGYIELRRQAESFILELYHAYWSLYLERTYLIQKRRLTDYRRRVVKTLKNRTDLDTLGSQLARAEADYASARGDLVRAEKAVRNAESRLRIITNVPELYNARVMEYVPISRLNNSVGNVDMKQAIRTGLRNRPEIEELLRQLQASDVREKVAKKQKQPTLNFILEAYYEGLAGESDMTGALDSQTENDLSYMAGLVFEVPLWNRAARARHTRRLLEKRQLSSKLMTTAETIVLEIQMATRELEAAYREIQTRYDSMVASTAETKDLFNRESMMLEGGERGSEYMERLLGSLKRLSEAEASFALSTVTYQLAYWNLERAKGSLLHKCGVEIVETDIDGVPVLELQASGLTSR